MININSNLFLKELAKNEILIVDGAMGTMLQAEGMPAGIEPARFCLENPDILKKIYKAYINAGANIITTATFGANIFKLPASVNGLDIFETNKKLAELARQAAGESGKPIIVAGDMGPSGVFVKPLGPVEPDEMIKAFERQAAGLAAGGVDLLFLETQFDLAEVRLTIAGIKKACRLPVMASMTFEQGVTLTGSTPEIFAQTMQNMGVAALGINCSLGPDEMIPVVENLLACSDCPVVVQPNAGLPELRDGVTVFPLAPEAFAQKTAKFAQMGAQILGGCCGTTPAHIKALAQAVENIKFSPHKIINENCVYLTSRGKLVTIGQNNPLAIIGERINPTGKPVLAKQLSEGKFEEVIRLADEQIAAGANVLDVNVGAPLVDETRVLPQAASLLVERQLLPLSLDSPDVEAIKKAAYYCPGSCLVNSISGETGRMENLGLLCRDLGLPFILLPLLGANLPELAKDRIKITETLLEQAENLGIPRRLILVDILALSVSSMPQGGRECLKMLQWCQKSGYPTTVGLSNISFGLPARILLNSTFMALARGAGLSSCIVNPCLDKIQETRDSLAVLEGFDESANLFINSYAQYAQKKAEMAASNTEGKGSAKTASTLYDCVLLGDREKVEACVDQEVAKGSEPFKIVNEILIPAITEVGSLYESKEYFLPQLIRSAETMQTAFARLKPLLEKENRHLKKPVIVMATVQGDIHDIGKNIVSLLLGNHGFEVIDAGKDVPANKIVQIAKDKNAQIIGLSALMTTTMPRMKDTIKIVREDSLPIKIMVGGAAVTKAFADSIGADAYCEDAVDSVKAAKRFTAAQD